MTKTALRKLGTGAALAASGVIAGAILAGTLTASAEPSPTPAPGTAAAPRPAETPLTGDVADRVRAAALAKYPGATIERVETDSDGDYEAHLTTKAGEHLVVEVSKAYAVTGTEQGRPGGHDGRGPGGPGPGPAETPLTGTVADKVRAAALAKYPGATIERLETDSDGDYEAHLTTKAGEHLVVEVDKAYAVTGTEQGGRGHGGPGGPGGRHGHGPDDPAMASPSPAAKTS
jgi:hypothetical protein